MKFEIPNYQPSAIVLHDPVIEQSNLQNTTVDLGLKPNGLTIANMRDMGSLSSPIDDLDKIAIARKESTELGKSIVEISKKANSAYKQIFGKSFKFSKNGS